MSRTTNTPGNASLERGSLLENAAALYALQAANYLIPILTLPYLIRVLGAEAYGAMAIAYATVFFMVLCIDAGINSLAVRDLSQVEFSHRRVNEIYVATQSVKFGLLLVCLAILLLMRVFVPEVQANAALYLASFMLVLGSMLFSTWLFQGLEIMHVTTVCSVAGRLLTTVCLFTFVRGPEDLVLAALLQASATAVSGLMSLAFVLGKLELRLLLPWPQLRTAIKAVLQNARPLWYSEFTTNAISNCGVFILSLFASDSMVGIYAAIEKIAIAAANAFQPLQKALFPKMVCRWRNSDKDFSYQRFWTQRLLLLGLLSAIGLYAVAPIVLTLLFGESWTAYTSLLRVVAIWLFVAVAASTLSQLWLLASGRNRTYAKVLTLGAVVQLLSSITGAALAGAHGLLLAMLFAEYVRLLGSATSLRILNPGRLV